MLDRNYIHVKRSKGKGGKGQYVDANGGFNAPGNHNEDQRKGNFSFDTIHGLKLKEVKYTVPSKAERIAKREEFNGVRDADGNVVVEGVRSKFLKMLANEHADLLKERLGLTDEQIDGMRKGFGPRGYNVHHKLALHGGGKNEFSNFILTPLYPHDQWHHDVMDAQLLGIRDGQSRMIKIPYTDEMIYDPKKFGFTKENQPVQPNYVSNVDPKDYPDLYKPEHVEAIKAKGKVAAEANKPKQTQPSSNLLARWKAALRQRG